MASHDIGAESACDNSIKTAFQSHFDLVQALHARIENTDYPDDVMHDFDVNAADDALFTMLAVPVDNPASLSAKIDSILRHDVVSVFAHKQAPVWETILSDCSRIARRVFALESQLTMDQRARASALAEKMEPRI